MSEDYLSRDIPNALRTPKAVPVYFSHAKGEAIQTWSRSGCQPLIRERSLVEKKIVSGIEPEDNRITYFGYANSTLPQNDTLAGE